ncbi:MAG: response regulator [Caulobacteraceae bacterium]
MEETISMPYHKPVTMVMVDDNIDEIFLTRRQVRSHGIVNHFVSERKSENLFNTLNDLYTIDDQSNVLILLDINMPRQDGFETLRKIKANKQFKDLPVIMFSASDDETDMAKSMTLGANGYIVKPFTMDSFIGALGSVPEMKYHLVR